MADAAPNPLAPEHDSSACAACRIVDTLTAHRDTTAIDWSHRRGTLNFAILIAQRECLAHQRAWSVDA